MRKRTIILCLFLLTGLASRCDAAEPSAAAKIARNLANCGEWEQAIKSYDIALAAAPTDAVCLARRGDAYAHIGNYKQAFADFDAAIKCDTKCPDAYYGRYRLYTLLGLNDLAEIDAKKALMSIGQTPKDPVCLLEHAALLPSGESDKRNEESQQVLVLTSHRVDVCNLLCASEAYNNLYKFREAAQCLERALKLSPSCYYLHSLLGNEYWNLKRWKEAVSQFDQYIACNHNNSEVFSDRAYCYEQLGQQAKAGADYDQAIKLAPENVSVLYFAVHTHHNLKQYEKEAADFSGLIAQDPANDSFYLQRADCYINLKKWDDALKDAEKVISLDPVDGRILQARIYDESGQYSLALAEYNNAVVKDPKQVYGYYSRGMFFRRHKQYKEAISDLSQAIKYRPDDAMMYCARGAALVSDRQYKRAIADCSRSLKLNPKRAHPYLSRGTAYAGLKLYLLALRDFDHAVRLFPKYGSGYYARSQVYKALGKTAQYKADLATAKKFGYDSADDMR
jgi:tetratricopeptide (TPR) repeat protein